MSITDILTKSDNLGNLKIPFAYVVMTEPLALSLGQKFELERMTRAIDATGDPQVLRGLAKQLLQAWQSQKAATQWVMRQQLGAPARFGPDLLGFLNLPRDLQIGADPPNYKSEYPL